MKTFTCTKCNKKFTKKSTYIKHINGKKECDKIKQYDIIDGKYKCQLCSKSYKYLNNYYVHNKKVHSNDVCTKPNNDDKIASIEAELDDLKKKYNELLKNQQTGQIINKGNLTVNNIENQNNTIITPIQYGEENHDDIDNEYIVDALSQGLWSVPRMIKNTHFNKKYPQFQNVYIPNIKHNRVMVSNGEYWETKNSSYIINNLRREKSAVLEEKF